MTVVVIMADPPREGLVLPELAETSPLSAAEAADLAEAMLRDTLLASLRSGGEEVIVNYPPEDELPEEHQTDETPEEELRALLEETLAEGASRHDDTADYRLEPQVGSTFAARAGNAATHLLDDEDVATVAIVEADAPMLLRTEIDSAAMKLRHSDVVVGPSEGGRLYFLGLGEPIDFTDVYAPPALETAVDRSVDASLDVDFMAQLTKVETGEDLLSLVSVLRARRAAGRIVPTYTTALVEDLGLRVEVADGERRLVR
ncbi:DUF2064 domain-containing protein [Halobacteriaceae archaeon GCM10025711]